MVPFLAVNIFNVEAMQHDVAAYLLYAIALAMVILIADKFMSRFKWW